MKCNWCGHDILNGEPKRVVLGLFEETLYFHPRCEVRYRLWWKQGGLEFKAKGDGV